MTAMFLKTPCETKRLGPSTIREAREFKHPQLLVDLRSGFFPSSECGMMRRQCGEHQTDRTRHGLLVMKCVLTASVVASDPAETV